MKKSTIIKLDFVIDKLTNSIENTLSGDTFQTEISRFTKRDFPILLKNKNWKFNWKKELDSITKEVFKLTIINNPSIIQGLVSYTIKADHIYMNLLESAPFNLGKNKIYQGVPGNLVAFVCKSSFQLGFDGFVSFTSKTKLISHYESSLGARHLGNHLMVIPNTIAKQLVDKYFKI